jgi:hypothetical protein
MKMRTFGSLLLLAILLGVVPLVGSHFSPISAGSVLRADGTGPVPPPIPLPPASKLS